MLVAEDSRDICGGGCNAKKDANVSGSRRGRESHSV
jgi:hypothetical protein